MELNLLVSSSQIRSSYVELVPLVWCQLFLPGQRVLLPLRLPIFPNRALTLPKNWFLLLLVERGVSAEEVAQRAVEAMGVQPRVAIECTGVESSIATAIYAVKFSGTVHVIGVGKDFQNIPFMHASVNDINIKFQYRYANSWPKAIRLVNEGVIDVKPLVTHRFSLEDAKKAFATTSDPSSGSVKVMIFDEQQ
jgi:hypothetical protein